MFRHSIMLIKAHAGQAIEDAQKECWKVALRDEIPVWLHHNDLWYLHDPSKLTQRPTEVEDFGDLWAQL